MYNLAAAEAQAAPGTAAKPPKWQTAGAGWQRSQFIQAAKIRMKRRRQGRLMSRHDPESFSVDLGSSRPRSEFRGQRHDYESLLSELK